MDTKSFKKELLFWLPSKLIEKKPPHSDANSMALRRKTLGEQLYTQLLRVFADDHTESSNILVKMVSEKRWNGLLVRIHRIKGALLNIGASKTAAHAQAIETKLEENKKISPAEIHELNRALYALLAEIKFLLRESKV